MQLQHAAKVLRTRMYLPPGILVGAWLAAAALYAQTPAAVIDYQREVHPILGAKCLACHSQEKRSGGLALATYDDVLEGGRSGAALKPGNGADSLIVLRTSGSVEPRMPLAGEPLTETELAVIRSWIDEGARSTPASPPAEPKWEAPLSLEDPVVPSRVWTSWTKPLDRFVAPYLKENGFSEPDPVSDAQFARRAYLDIWGLLPAPNELRAFVKDRARDKREKLVARLLADDRKYAENWISFWNDLLRNDQGVNYYSETASRKSITEWLLKSLQSNLPYDKFVAKLLHPTEPDDPEGFLVGVNWRGVVNASQTPAMQAAQNTAQIFLGLNLKCNSCHDSFISKWKLKDAYSLASYFSPEDRLQLYRCDVAQEEYTQPAFLFPELERAPASASLEDRRATAAAIFTDPRNGRLPRTLVNRIWQRLLGHGIVANPDEMDQQPWNPKLLDWIAGDFVKNGYDLKRLIASIVSSRAYEMPAVARNGDPPRQYVFRGPEVRRMTAEQFADAIGSITGEWPVFLPNAGLRGPGTAQGEAEAAKPGVFTRNWRVGANPLTRALGRPIRDQVYSTREGLATTLQALELVNGETLTRSLSRGARRILAELPPEPASLFDRPMMGRNPRPASFDIDVSKASKLWLLVEDLGSYSPEKVEAVWAQAELVGPDGATLLSSLAPMDASGVRVGDAPVEVNGVIGSGVRVKTPSRLVYDLAGKRFTRLRGVVALENRDITFEINPDLRFFIFGQEPNMDRLTPVAPETPVPVPPALRAKREVVDRVFWQALGRAPSAVERRLAETALEDPARSRRPSAAGLADLLWVVLMKPEFQLIY